MGSYAEDEEDLPAGPADPLLETVWGRAGLESPKLRLFRELLQVRPEDGVEKIKKNYRRLALDLHPDRNPGRDTGRAFAQVAEAHDALTNPDRMAEINREFEEGLRSRIQIGGRTFDAGAFFGFRFYRRYDPDRRLRRADRLLAGPRFAGPLEGAAAGLGDNPFPVLESETSILDAYEWDLLELYFGGRMDAETLRLLEEKYGARTEGGLNELPWYIDNINGYYSFAERRFEEAVRLFGGACERVPENIVLLYRHGLSLEAYAADSAPGLGPAQARRLTERGVVGYKEALRIGWTRKGQPRQKCITIRKQLADALLALGRRREARGVWQEIERLRPGSIEAKSRADDLAASRLLFQGAARLAGKLRRLLPGPSME